MSYLSGKDRTFHFKKLISKLIYIRTASDNPDPVSYRRALRGSKKKIADMTRPNTSFLNTAAQLEHEDLGKIYKAIDSSFMSIITPGTEGLLGFTMSWQEKDASVKKEILRFLSKADFGNIQDIKIETKEIPASILNRLSNEMMKFGFAKKIRQVEATILIL